MPKISRNGDYDLNNKFRSSVESAYAYTQDDANKLLVWIQGENTTNLIDRSSHQREVLEVNLVSSGINSINYQNYTQQFRSVNFNGTTTNFSVADSSDLSFTSGGQDSSFSASLWVRFTDFSQIHGIFGKSTSTSNREYMTTVSTSGAITFQLVDESSNHFMTVASANSVVSAGTWHHIVFTYNGNENHTGMNIYVDGVRLSKSTAAKGASYAGLEDLGARLYAGVSLGPAGGSDIRRLKGDIAEMALWSKELNVNSILAIYHRKGYSEYSSGYLNNPIRTVIRDRDNKLNTYPRVKRLGYPESSYTREPFTDTNVVMYGKLIKDKFDLDPLIDNEFVQEVDSSQWVVSSRRAVKVRREEFDNDDPTNPNLPGALSLNGLGTSARWIRTKDKVKNATLRFTALVGPYIFSDPRSLKLYRGAVTDTLAVQVSKDANTWTTITLDANNVSNPHVNIISGQLDPTSPIFDGENVNKLPLNLDGAVRPQFNVSINFDQLRVVADPDASFYVRILQNSVSTPYRAVWGIDNIELVSRDEEIVAQTGLIRSHNSHLSSSIATPNFLSSMQFTGSSAPHISNGLFTTSDINPTTLPFDDSRHAIDPSNRFYKTSVSPKVLPGFSAPLSSKDLIEVDLSPTVTTTIGGNKSNTGNLSNPDIGQAGSEDHQIMVYWNKDLRRWDKIGFPVSVNSNRTKTSASTIVNVLTSSAIGFSTYGVAASGSGTGVSDATAKLLPASILNSYNRPTDTFGFPFSGRYHATSSLCITAKDLGITKPFVFEKSVLNFDMGYRTGPEGGNNNNVDNLIMQNQRSFDNFSTTIRHFTPSFFILAQRPGSFNSVITVLTGSTNDSLSYTESIPNEFQLNSGSNNKTTVADVRELVTYGQYTLAMSRSDGSDFTPSITFEDFLDTPLVRDGLSVYRGVSTSTKITGSFQLEFPVRSTSRIEAFSPFYVIETPGSGMGASAISGRGVYGIFANIRMGKQKDGRSYGGLTSTSRALVNGLGAFTPSKDNLTIKYLDNPFALGGTVTYFTDPLLTSDRESVDKPSPYIIFPEDKLIFGWQIPLTFRMSSLGGTAADPSTYMQLFGNSKLKMYGSFVQNGTEFHEGLNQNLTTDAVHEVIGNDPVVDRFAVATREELTGSFSDTYLFHENQPTLSIYGRLIVTEETKAGLLMGAGGAGTTDLRVQRSLLRGTINPENRLSKEVEYISAMERGTFSALFRTLAPQAGSNESFVDGTRVFVDSRIISLEVNRKHYRHYVYRDNAKPTNYGSMQNVLSINDTGDRAARLGGSPKYVFSGKHFGHYADMLRQGFDGTFVDDPTTDEDNVVVEPAVKVRFVESEYDANNEDFRTFRLVEPGTVDGTAYRQFQSSNISTFATSSLPFIDDNSVRNRTYTNEIIEVV